MKKLLTSIVVILFIAVVFLFTACSVEYDNDGQAVVVDHEIAGTVKDVKVISKDKHLKPLRYVITVDKNGEKLELLARSKDSFNAIQEGTTVTIGYTKDFYIETINFPKLED